MLRFGKLHTSTASATAAAAAAAEAAAAAAEATAAAVAAAAGVAAADAATQAVTEYSVRWLAHYVLVSPVVTMSKLKGRAGEDMNRPSHHADRPLPSTDVSRQTVCVNMAASHDNYTYPRTI